MVEIDYTLKCDGFEILTDEGWKKISLLHKTNKEKKYIILFESGKEIECADRHIFINRNYEEIFACDLNIGDVLISDDGYDIVFDVLDTKTYDFFYDITIDSEHKLYFTEGILSHNSNTMINMAARQVLNGYNVAILTLEMSEDANAQRFDSIYSGYDINRIYIHKETSGKMLKKLNEVKKNNEIGKLFIKEFPTGSATVNDYRVFLRELGYRGIKIDCLFVDYINLMKPEYKTKGDLYSDGKRISEELRALGLEFKLPIVSCSQLNREGMFTNLKELDFTYIAESVGIPSTADSIFILGVNEDDWVYQSEIHYKVVKNRLGGRISEYGKFYLDKRSLKMYDDSELDLWIEDAKISGDERIINKTKE